MKPQAKNIMRMFLLALVCVSVFTVTGNVRAQDDPPLPAPLSNLIAEGAQMRYLGRNFGLDGWIAIQGGQEQYFYVTQDGRGFVMGLLFDDSGKMLTMKQVGELQQKSGGSSLDFFAMDDAAAPQAAPTSVAAAMGDNTRTEFKTPSEQLFDDIESSNWIPLGDLTAPVIYSFVDPQCPHCHGFIQDLRKNYIDNGLVQVRIIPVGYKSGSMEQAAFLLAVPNPQRRWYSHIDGDKEALPVTPGINQQGVQRNMAIMQSWNFNVTPLTVYRGKDGTVKIMEGRANDVAALVADLPPGQSVPPQVQ